MVTKTHTNLFTVTVISGIIATILTLLSHVIEQYSVELLIID